MNINTLYIYHTHTSTKNHGGMMECQPSAVSKIREKMMNPSNKEHGLKLWRQTYGFDFASYHACFNCRYQCIKEEFGKFATNHTFPPLITKLGWLIQTYCF